MIRILFVCHGNICRSPMAEFIMKARLDSLGLSDRFFIASAATSDDELGQPVYPEARQKLAQNGLSCEGKRARQLTLKDYADYDYIIGMDTPNINNMKQLFNGDPQNKISRLMDWTDTQKDVADPWYTRDFEAAWQDINLGCKHLLATLSSSSPV